MAGTPTPHWAAWLRSTSPARPASSARHCGEGAWGGVGWGRRAGRDCGVRSSRARAGPGLPAVSGTACLGPRLADLASSFAPHHTHTHTTQPHCTPAAT